MDSYLFSGLKVLDVATVIAAPAAAMILAEFGADVIKIETPEGDLLRRIEAISGLPEDKQDYMWQLDGRNKRSIALDLMTEEGMAVMHQLVSECDVFITNQPFPLRDKLGLNYEDLKIINPKMVYASLSAYGEHGPERDRKAFDQLAYWARGGQMDLMRDKGSRPVQGLAGMGDHPTSLAIYSGIVTALLQRERTGEGGLVHTSLMANGIWSNGSTIQAMIGGGNGDFFREERHTPRVQLRVYRCSDDRWLQLNMLRSLDEFDALVIALDAPDLMYRFELSEFEDLLDVRVEFGEALEKIFMTRTSSEWLDIFALHDIPINRVGKVEEIVGDEQAIQNEMLIKPNDPEITMPFLVKHPIQISSVPQVEPKRSPRLSEHAEEILQELGYDEIEIQKLRSKGVI